MHRYTSVSIPKPGQGQINEDSALAEEGLIAVADGAGGGGVYADRWSAYLLQCLPREPITSFEALDNWIGGIWEAFYAEYEQVAKAAGGMVLNKFYDEGSFSTLAAAWVQADGCRWTSYGDSVVFHYRRDTDILEHSFTRLSDFNKPPWLISLQDDLHQEGFRCGAFTLAEDSIVFCTSDALAHYVLMLYELTHREAFEEELVEARNAETKNSAFISSAEGWLTAAGKPRDFYHDVLRKLVHCRYHPANFQRHLEALLRKHLIALDDYSLAVFA